MIWLASNVPQDVVNRNPHFDYRLIGAQIMEPKSPPPNLIINTKANRLNGWGHDDAGNTTNDVPYTYIFDGRTEERTEDSHPSAARGQR